MITPRELAKTAIQYIDELLELFDHSWPDHPPLDQPGAVAQWSQTFPTPETEMFRGARKYAHWLSEIAGLLGYTCAPIKISNSAEFLPLDKQGKPIDGAKPKGPATKEGDMDLVCWTFFWPHGGIATSASVKKRIIWNGKEELYYGQNGETIKTTAIASLKTWRKRFENMVTAEGESPETGSDDRSTDHLERATPLFDRLNGEWIPGHKLAKVLKIKVATLGTYRRQGKKTSDDMLGQDTYGRIWRRKETPRGWPWYLKNSLSAEERRRVDGLSTSTPD